MTWHICIYICIAKLFTCKHKCNMILGELTNFKPCALRQCLIRSYHINQNTTSVLQNKEHFSVSTLTLNAKLGICHRMYTTWDKFFFALHIIQRYIPAVICQEATKFAVTYWAVECSHSALSVKDLQASQTKHKLHNAQLSSTTHCWLAARLHHEPAINRILKLCSFKSTMSDCVIDVKLRFWEGIYGAAYNSHGYTWKAVSKLLDRQCCLPWLMQLLLQANLLHPAHLSSPHEKHSNEVMWKCQHLVSSVKTEAF